MISRFPQISFLFLSIIFLSFVRLFGLQRNATQRNIVICYNLDKKYWTGNLHTSPYYRWGIQVSGLIRLIQKKKSFFFWKNIIGSSYPLYSLYPKKNPLSEISEKWSWLIQARIHEKNPITRKEKSFFFQAIAFNYAMKWWTLLRSCLVVRTKQFETCYTNLM